MNTSYADPVAGLPGMSADGVMEVVETGIAGAAIKIGDGLIAANSGANVIPANSASGKFRGIARFTQTLEMGKGYEQYSTVNVGRQGRYFVSVTAAVAIDDAAYCDVADAGKFTNVATNNLATGGVFKSATTGAGTAIVEINLP